MFTHLLRAGLLAAASIDTASALSQISVKGAKFFAEGEQFFLKGVAYQGTPADPLVNTTQCQEDAALMKTIGTNSIRVYHVDAGQNHDGCMRAFDDAGIYLWLDMDTFNTSINQADPTWTEAQFSDFSDVMDAFQSYDNLGGLWIANEAITDLSGSLTAPYLKAAVADMKSYMSAKKYRTIPIGYSAADIAELRPMLQNYLACGSDYSESIDFFGLNSYEWCGDATYNTSGYSNLQALAEGYSIPIFFSETGCNVPEPRTFGDQAAIFGPEMTNTWSGSIIYEWVQETNNYGIVTYPNNLIYEDAPVPLQPDFDTLSSVWKDVKPSGVAESGYTPSLSAPACPSATGGWQVNGNVPLPTLGTSVINAVAASVKPTAVAAPTSTTSSTTSVARAASTKTSETSETSKSSTMGSTTVAAAATTTSATASASTSKAAGQLAAVPAMGGGLLWLLGLLL
ncbi:1,3-beta-glucanosyltransferase gas2 [Lachnellula suecica]|uniref:1,3-beta-glucanosyltransferase n=1 Tax=Lachnellula suecica TaxID=602035 RepID=A0A8T9CAW2_9HELO|nr:1,3-beta-glucanosyltransferase gas2 [Lachnellula suecica]